MKCSVYPLVGENCITMEDGQKVYDLIHPELQAGRAVELDFQGSSVFASPFFNAAIGQLLEDIPPETLNRLLTVSNMGPVGMNVLKRVIENAKEYYSNPDVRTAVDAALAQLATEK
ncbi:MAG: DUF4325 domain-containing protein [Planctomycetes bacterium]|nr:DUF4325 domain-containing protein [Planctomycetota bacterium]MBM4084439.1 DUF4325 domain-containing protein [Planctomycetota bacterium]